MKQRLNKSVAVIMIFLIAYTSGNPAVYAAEVNDGIVLCEEAILAADGDSEVVVPVTAVSMTQKEFTIERGKLDTLTATVYPDNATNKELFWSSSDPLIVNVTNEDPIWGLKAGEIYAYKVGTAVITAEATDGSGAKDTCIVTVLPQKEASFASDLYNDDDAMKEMEKRGGIPDGLWMAGLNSTYQYTGREITPEVHVFDYEDRLREKLEYSVEYSNNTNVGNAEIRITGKGNYEGEEVASFAIIPADLTTAEDLIANSSNGNVEVYWNGMLLAKDKDYTLSANTTDNTVVVSGIGNFSGTRTIEVTSSQLTTLTEKMISVQKNVTFNGEYIEPIFSVKDKKAHLSLVSGTQIRVSFEDNRNAGIAKIVVAGVGKNGYIGTAEKTFRILSAKVQKKNMYVQTSALYMKGGATTSATAVFSTENKQWDMREGVDYVIKYKNNKRKGKATAIIKGIGNFKGSASYKFKVDKTFLDEDVTCTYDMPYREGKKAGYYRQNPVIIDINGKRLTKGVDYKITSYSINGKKMNAGSKVNEGDQITVNVKGIGMYTGKTSADYYIRQTKNLKDVTINEIPSQEYTGQNKNPEPVVLWQGNALVRKKDYDCVYYDDVDPGTGIVFVGGISNEYSGGRFVSFRIVKRFKLV